MPAALRPNEREERAEALAPLVVWVEERGIFFSRVIRHAYERRGRSITRSHANQIKTGWAPAPEWLIEECCAVLCVPASVIYPQGLPEAFRPYAPPQGRQARLSGASGASGVSEWSVA
jgi:hypothetical protein